MALSATNSRPLQKESVNKMPYVSKAQDKWAHTPKGKKALGGQSAVAEWDSASKGLALPDRSPRSKKSIGHRLVKGSK